MLDLHSRYLGEICSTPMGPLTSESYLRLVSLADIMGNLLKTVCLGSEYLSESDRNHYFPDPLEIKFDVKIQVVPILFFLLSLLFMTDF